VLSALKVAPEVEQAADSIADVGIVVIGRNEGNRLKRALPAALAASPRVLYVDSGSTDGSGEYARSQHASVVDLDASEPFSAVRGRNAGWRRLLEIAPEIRFIQLVDGDCELVGGWLEAGRRALIGDPKVAIVCGRLRERDPSRSIYQRLCDLEWDAPTGFVDRCGGNAMVRVDALSEVGGFLTSLVAGEEPGLCFRLRQRGWKILRLEAEMAVHDAAIDRFALWWTRSRRSGHAAAEGAWLHGRSPERYNVRRTARIAAWALGIPLAIGALAFSAPGWALALSCLYPVQWCRIVLREHRRDRPLSHAALFATFGMIAKLPELVGAVGFLRSLLRARPSRLIEYK
jgi:GT2 family glycosyltransferase